MALDGVSWVRGGLVETALAARGLAVRQNRRRPLLPSLGSCSPWELVSASDLVAAGLRRLNATDGTVSLNRRVFQRYPPQPAFEERWRNKAHASVERGNTST